MQGWSAAMAENTQRVNQKMMAISLYEGSVGAYLDKHAWKRLQLLPDLIFQRDAAKLRA